MLIVPLLLGVLMGRRWLAVLLVCAVMVLRLLLLLLLLAKGVQVLERWVGIRFVS